MFFFCGQEWTISALHIIHFMMDLSVSTIVEEKGVSKSNAMTFHFCPLMEKNRSICLWDLRAKESPVQRTHLSAKGHSLDRDTFFPPIVAEGSLSKDDFVEPSFLLRLLRLVTLANLCHRPFIAGVRLLDRGRRRPAQPPDRVDGRQAVHVEPFHARASGGVRGPEARDPGLQRLLHDERVQAGEPVLRRRRGRLPLQGHNARVEARDS